MANKHLKTESLEMLIKAVQDYREELSTNRKILENAANVCGMAMGSDDIVKKHINRLYLTLEELDKTSKIAEEVTEALIEDERRAIDVYEDEGE